LIYLSRSRLYKQEATREDGMDEQGFSRDAWRIWNISPPDGMQRMGNQGCHDTKNSLGQSIMSRYNY